MNDKMPNSNLYADDKAIFTLLKKTLENDGYASIEFMKKPSFWLDSAFRLHFTACRKNGVLDEYGGALICQRYDDEIWSNVLLTRNCSIAQQLENIALTHSLFFDVSSYTRADISKVLVWKAKDTFWQAMVNADLNARRESENYDGQIMATMHR